MEVPIPADMFFKITLDTVFVQHEVQQGLTEAVYHTSLTFFFFPNNFI